MFASHLAWAARWTAFGPWRHTLRCCSGTETCATSNLTSTAKWCDSVSSSCDRRTVAPSQKRSWKGCATHEWLFIFLCDNETVSLLHYVLLHDIVHIIYYILYRYLFEVFLMTQGSKSLLGSRARRWLSRGAAHLGAGSHAEAVRCKPQRAF